MPFKLCLHLLRLQLIIQNLSFDVKWRADGRLAGTERSDACHPVPLTSGILPPVSRCKTLVLYRKGKLIGWDQLCLLHYLLSPW